MRVLLRGKEPIQTGSSSPARESHAPPQAQLAHSIDFIRTIYAGGVAAPVGSVKGQTVHSVIECAAHVLGGVHTGKAKGDDTEALSAASAQMRLAGTDPSLVMLRDAS